MESKKYMQDKVEIKREKLYRIFCIADELMEKGDDWTRKKASEIINQLRIRRIKETKDE